MDDPNGRAMTDIRSARDSGTPNDLRRGKSRAQLSDKLCHAKKVKAENTDIANIENK